MLKLQDLKDRARSSLFNSAPSSIIFQLPPIIYTRNFGTGSDRLYLDMGQSSAGRVIIPYYRYLLCILQMRKTGILPKSFVWGDGKPKLLQSVAILKVPPWRCFPLLCPSPRGVSRLWSVIRMPCRRHVYLAGNCSKCCM